MFKMELLVDDKRLAEVMKRLGGIADVRTCAYVPNLEARANGRIYQTSGDVIELLTKELHKRKLTEIRGPEFKALLDTLGMNTTSYSHYVGSLIQAGVLKKGKKIKNTMQYIVTGK